MRILWPLLIMAVLKYLFLFCVTRRVWDRSLGQGNNVNCWKIISYKVRIRLLWGTEVWIVIWPNNLEHKREMKPEGTGYRVWGRERDLDLERKNHDLYMLITCTVPNVVCASVRLEGNVLNEAMIVWMNEWVALMFRLGYISAGTVRPS